MRRKPMTQTRLLSYARWYLERWPASEARLRRKLEERLQRDPPEAPPDEVAGWVDEACDQLRSQGLVQDAQLASDRLSVLARRGASARRVHEDLRRKGIQGPTLDDAVALAREGEWDAARTWVRKHRCGRWASGERRDHTSDLRDLARMARAGFPYAIARAVLAESGPEKREEPEGGEEHRSQSPHPLHRDPIR
jgi:regulatory protein